MNKLDVICNEVHLTMKQQFWRITFPLLVCLLTFFSGSSFAEDKEVVIAGAGPSTKVVMEFVKQLSKQEAAKGYSFTVPKKSAKHAGGIKNASKHVFGRTGRPLNEKEKAGDIEEIYLAKMPIAFIAGGKSGVKSLSINQICGIFTGKHKNWKEVGGNDASIVVITREPTEALFLTLKKDVPCMNRVINTKYVMKKDDHVINFMKTTTIGSRAIGFGAVKNFPEKPIISVKGFNSGVNLGLVYSKSNADHPLVKAAKKVARSDEWRAATKKMDVGWPY